MAIALKQNQANTPFVAGTTKKTNSNLKTKPSLKSLLPLSFSGDALVHYMMAARPMQEDNEAWNEAGQTIKPQSSAFPFS